MGYLTKLGTDPFGKHILHLMAQNGISTELTQFSGERTTGFMLKSMVSHGDPEIYYYRKNSAASTLSAEDVAQLDLSAYSVLHMTGIFARPVGQHARRHACCFALQGKRADVLVRPQPAPPALAG